MSCVVASACSVDPCLGWVQEGETYTVELVQNLQPLRPTQPPGLFLRDLGGDVTCGSMFDLEVGDSIELEVLRLRPAEDGSCHGADAQARVRGVALSPHREGPFFVGDQSLRYQGTASLGDSCTGAYSVGVERVLEGAEGPVTDHVLYREFRSDVRDCERPNSTLFMSVPPLCVDDWSVRIHDSAGRVVTRDRSGLAGHDGG